MSVDDAQQKRFLVAYDQLSDALFRHSYFRVSNREVALDMVQDCFTKTWNHMVQGKEVNDMKSFLYRVMNNLIIDYYRKTKSSSLDDLLDEGFDVSDVKEPSPEMHSELLLAKRALEKLPPPDREVIVLRHVDGLSVQEIAKMSGESENVVSVRLHRAMKRLQTIINPE